MAPQHLQAHLKRTARHGAEVPVLTRSGKVPLPLCGVALARIPCVDGELLVAASHHAHRAVLLLAQERSSDQAAWAPWAAQPWPEASIPPMVDRRGIAELTLARVFNCVYCSGGRNERLVLMVEFLVSFIYF